MMPSTRSLRVRLPLLILGLVSIVLVTFMVVAYRLVEMTLVDAGKTRSQAAATQLADLMRLSAQQRMLEAQRLAREAAVRRFVEQPDAPDAVETVRKLIAPLAAASGQPTIELWNARGERLLTQSAKPAAPPAANVEAPTTAPTTGVSAFRESHGVISFDIAADIPEAPAAQGQSTAAPLGRVVIRRSFSAVPTSDALAQLLGAGAVIKLGNQAGGVWSDLKTVVPMPPLSSSAGPGEYKQTDGSWRIGAVRTIAGTPWALAVEFPRAMVVAPARVLLQRTLLIGLACIALATVGAAFVSGRITTPLHELTSAAEAMSAGNYNQRVFVSRRDEIGRLGVSFNAMAAQVADGKRDLERRVDERVSELKATREELDRFFSLSLDLLCIADNGYLKRVNPAWQELLGWTAEELTSVPFIERVHPDDVERTRAEMARLRKGIATISFENRCRCKNGTYRWLEWKAVPVSPNGLTYAAARDITQQRQAAVARETHIAELAALNHELEAFSYSVSHDLRAPLRHITGFAALLSNHAKTTLDEQGQRYLTTMVGAANRMGRLIDDLLAFSRMGRAPIAKRRVALGDLVEEARKEVAVQAEGRDIQWTMHQLPSVDADPAMLRLAMVNLLSNAVKYSAPRHPATIEIGLDGHQNGETVIYVRDNGVGFDMHYAPKLFGVFQRLHGADEFEGTGIGLANVRRIVQRHGGRVWAHGVVDQGATFFVALPTKEALQ